MEHLEPHQWVLGTQIRILPTIRPDLRRSGIVIPPSKRITLQTQVLKF